MMARQKLSGVKKIEVKNQILIAHQKEGVDGTKKVQLATLTI